VSGPDHGPHATGRAECLRCGRCWTAVWPVGVTERLECSCGAPVPLPQVEPPGPEPWPKEGR
jgi:hypothetical protein